MAGVSEAPFRQICRRMGADVVLSEFLSSEAIRRRIRNTLEGAEFEEVERPDRNPDLRGRSQRHGRGRAAHHRALPAGVHRHQLRLPGQEGRAAKRRLRLPPRPGAGRSDHPGRHRRDPPAGDGQDAERLERRATRSGGHRAPDAGRRRPGVHPARAHPDPDVHRPGRLGRDRPGGRSARHSGHRQRRRRRPRRTSSACGITPVAPASWSVAARSAIPGSSGTGRRCSPAVPAPPPPDAAERFEVALEHARLALRLQGDTRKTVIEFRKHLGWYTQGLPGRERPAPAALPDRVDGRGGVDLPASTSSRSPTWRETRAARGPARGCGRRPTRLLTAALERLRHLPFEDLEIRPDRPSSRAPPGTSRGRLLRGQDRGAGGRDLRAVSPRRSDSFLGTRCAERAGRGGPLARFPGRVWNPLARTVHLPAGRHEAPVAATPAPSWSSPRGPAISRSPRRRRSCAEAFGHRVERLVDVGVAGLHRLLASGRRAAGGRRDHRGGRDGGGAPQRRRRAGRGAGRSRCRPAWATAPPSAGSPRSWRCSTPAPPASRS